MPVGQEIRRRREEQGLSLTDLARLAGVSKGYLSEIESNSAARPSAATLFKIASALGTSVGELLGKSGPDSQPVNLDIPESLRQFAEEAKLPDAEVRMLAGIRYRGKSPKTADDWRYIYESIRLRTEGR
jgi:transcriptional regulator with XRE-family HTH domain